MRVGVGGSDETAKQRVWFVRLAMKLRMKLARDEERMIGQFDHLDQLPIR